MGWQPLEKKFMMIMNDLPYHQMWNSQLESLLKGVGGTPISSQILSLMLSSDARASVACMIKLTTL